MGYLGTKPQTATTVADNAVSSSAIQDGAINTADLADSAVTNAKIANNAVNTSKIADASVTVAKLSATGTPNSSSFLRGDNVWGTVSPIGEGQSWQNLTSSRSSGTVYTNSTGRPIAVSFSTNFGAPNDTFVICGGIEIWRYGVTNNFTTRVGTSFIVPNNTTYSITAPAGFASWAELR